MNKDSKLRLLQELTMYTWTQQSKTSDSWDNIYKQCKEIVDTHTNNKKG